MNESRVLIVDDDEAMLRAVSRILSPDHAVRTTSDPRAASDLAREFRPHLAVVDIRMPGMTGFQVMEALLENDPDLHVILMTGSVFDVDAQLVRALQEKAYYYIMKPFDRNVLRALVDRSLETRRLEDERRRHLAQMEAELVEAHAFQQSMMPDTEAALAGLRIRAAHRPCTRLAGDLFDYAETAGGRLAVLVADVVGHGASAALLTGVVKSAFHAAAREDYDPLTVVHRFRDDLEPFSEDRFATLLCLRISPREERLDFVNAGHEGGVLWDGARARELPPTGPLVSSAFPTGSWEAGTAGWGPAHRVLLFTDGLVEARGASGFLGRGPIDRAVAGEPGADVIGSVLAELDAYVPGDSILDDVTLVEVAATL